ncbi:DUF6531 domain-containing protein [Paraburkholderia lacunae]|uniref:DUF6531 domain-containing protein n=1 Tax=Paraburkholderia lacunae TaxID=2211104 RepID=UPI001FCB2ACE|nr:DUF6531 domain-containing protein [Paraburkholderia lacunae]
MQSIDAFAARRALSRSFVLFLFLLVSWFAAPHARAIECPSAYAEAGAFPTDPLCPLKAASADFGGMGGYICGNPLTIAAYCGGASSGGDTVEPVPAEGASAEDGDLPDGQPGDTGGCAADATAGCGGSTSGADPVNLSTGQFRLVAHDLHVADTLALDVARVYRSSTYDASGRPLAGVFGVGTTFAYDSYLVFSAANGSGVRLRVELRLPSGVRVPFTPRTGTMTVWDNLTSPGGYYRARINGGSAGMTLTLRDGRVQQFTMVDGLYRLSRVQDRNGNAVVIARDNTSGAITSITSPNGRKLTFTTVTGARGTSLVSRVTDPLGREVSYQYDSQDRLVQFTDAAGGIWKYGWDSKSRLVSVTDPEGSVQVSNTYDDRDRVINQKLADASTFGIAYTLVDGKATQTEVTDRRGSIRRLEFDANGRVVRNTYPAGQPEQQVQTYTYDATGRVTNLTTGGRQYTFVYDANGNRTNEADQSGTLVTRTFDSYSQLLTEAQAGDPQRGVATVYTYDAKGNLLTVTDRLGNRTTWTNDGQGRVLTVTDALKGVTRYTYTNGDLTGVTDPLNRTTQYTTDAAGRVTAIQYPLGNRTKRSLDALDRTTDITDALGGVTRFTWDRNGRLLSQADPRGVTTRYTYNAIGRPVSKTDPLGRSETYTWTPAGQLATVTDRKGQTTAYAYDAAGRLVWKELTPPGADRAMRRLSYAWDAVTGRFSSVSQSGWKDPYFTDNTAMLKYRHDPVTGKVASVFEFPILPGHQTQKYEYAPDSRELTRVVLDNATVDYTRDAEHRITQAQYTLNDEAPKTFTFAYDTLGRRSKATLGNGIAIAYTWDAASQLTGITYSRSDGATLGTLTYAYDAAGRRTSMGGTLARVTLPQPVADARYNGANQLIRWAGQSFTYDANGSLTGDGVNRYGWSVANEFSQLDSADGKKSSIQYQ